MKQRRHSTKSAMPSITHSGRQIAQNTQDRHKQSEMFTSQVVEVEVQLVLLVYSNLQLFG